MERRTLMTGFAALLAMTAARGALAQAAGPPFKPEQLDQMLAPIALYSDALLSQVLMAATYPLEVVEAARWIKANPSLKGEAAVKGAEEKTWDVSVKSLTAFPQILTQMSDQLEWMQKLGDAFLGQQKDVADSIQRLRKMAHDSGALRSSEQQQVEVRQGPPQVIVIEPASPQAIYVPVYEPSWAYGAWPHAGYPPYYYPPAPGYGYGAPLLRGFMFGVGIAAAGAIFGGWNWNNGDVNVNVNRAVNIDRNFDRNKLQNGNWQHRPEHRKGVGYRDSATREKYGRNTPGADGRQAYRGKDMSRPGGQPGQRPAGGGERPGAGQRPAGGGERPGAAQRPAGGGERAGQHGNRGNSALNGANRSGQQVNREAARGRASGGGARGGGGGGRGGGGGGRGGGGGGRR
jgi:hypothetical protein